MSLFRCLGLTKVSVQIRGFVCKYFVTNIGFHCEELLAPRPTPKLEDHPLSAVHGCLFNTFDNNNNNNNNNKPVIIVATGTNSKSLRQYLSNIQGKHRYQGITKNNYIRRHCKCTVDSTNVKVQNILNMRSNIISSTSCKYRAAAALCALETWFVAGI
jgi:hypothetical protein